MSERRRVLFLIPSLGGGGAERVFSLLLRHLDRSSFEPHVALLKTSGVFGADVPEDVAVHHIHAPRVRYAVPQIVALTWKLRPHAILSTLGHLNIALLAAKPLLPRGVKLIAREAVLTSAFLSGEKLRPDMWGWLYRRCYPRADRLVCLSDSIANDLAEQFNVPREKLVRIYNPVDIDQVGEAARLSLNPYSGSGPHLVAVGRLTRQKGFDILLQAMPAVLASLPQASLTILGEGELRSALQQQARQMGMEDRVSLLPFQKNPWAYIKHADVFVLPSRFEGMPNVLLEALALNARIVAADCPGAVREVQQLDDRVVLVPPEDPDMLAGAIVSACSAARPEDCDHQYRQRLRAFDVQSVVLQYSKLLAL